MQKVGNVCPNSLSESPNGITLINERCLPSFVAVNVCTGNDDRLSGPVRRERTGKL